MNLPDPIVKVTKNGEAITMEAINESTYEIIMKLESLY